MDFAIAIAETGGTYETEYDGRTYEECFFCDRCLSEGQPHKKSCAYIKATESEGWQQHLKKCKEVQNDVPNAEL